MSEAVSARSEMDPWMLKAESTNDAIGTSGITYLRKGKKMLCSSCERSEKNVRNSPAENKVYEEEGGGGAPVAGAEISLQTVENIVVMQVVPLQPMKDCSGADIHTVAHGGLYDAAGGCALTEGATHGEKSM